MTPTGLTKRQDLKQQSLLHEMNIRKAFAALGTEREPAVEVNIDMIELREHDILDEQHVT